MARTPSGSYTPARDEMFVGERWIQAGAAAGQEGLRSLVSSDHYLWGSASPPVIAHPCHVGVAGTQYYATNDGAAFGARPVSWAYKGHWGREDRDELLWSVWAECSDVGTSGEVEIASILDGTSVTIAIAAGTVTWTLHQIQCPFSIAAGDAGEDVYTVKVRRAGGAGEVRVQSIAARWNPWAGILPNTVQPSGWTPHDTDEIAADAPLHVDIARRFGDNLAVLEMPPDATAADSPLWLPISGWSVALDVVTGKNTYLWADQLDWQRVGPVMWIPRQYRIDSMTAQIWGYANGASGHARLVNLDRGVSSNDAALPLVGVADPADPADWRALVLPLRPLGDDYDPTRVGGTPEYFDRVALEMQGDGADEAVCAAMVAQYTGGA